MTELNKAVLMGGEMSQAEYNWELLEIQREMQEAMSDGDNFKFAMLQAKRHNLMKRWQLEHPQPKIGNRGKGDYLPWKYWKRWLIVVGSICAIITLIAWSYDPPF